MSLFPSLQQVKVDGKVAEQNEAPVLHSYCTCDRCGATPIKGIRWKCSNCPDFDLCSACEALNLHDPSHLLLKVRIPLPPIGAQQTPLCPESVYSLFERIRQQKVLQQQQQQQQQYQFDPFAQQVRFD